MGNDSLHGSTEAMSLPRLYSKAPIAINRIWVRCFSTRGTEDVLDILASSPARRHPAAGPARKTAKDSSLLMRFTKESGLARGQTEREILESEQRANFQKQIYRRWTAGDVYAPHDLSGPEQKKWKTGRRTPLSDAFDTLGINPVNEYKNFTMMSEYMTEMGRIKHSRDTGLRPKNQRKIAKAIRRAIGLGLMPSVHRHPLVLKKSSPTRFL